MKFTRYRVLVLCAIIGPMLTLLLFTETTDSQDLRALRKKHEKIRKLGRQCRSGNDKSCHKLTQIVQTDSIESVRAHAVQYLAEPAFLEKIAREDNSEEVRDAAVKNKNFPNDQAVIKDILKTATDWNFRRTLVSKLTDQSLLAQIAQTDSMWGVRLRAVENTNLNDQTLFAQIAQNDSQHSVRGGAIRRLSDNALLGKIAKTDSNSTVRGAATQNLTDQGLLFDIAKTDNSEYVRKCAVENKNFTDEVMLATVVMTDRDGDVAKTAVNRIQDQAILADIALKATTLVTGSLKMSSSGVQVNVKDVGSAVGRSAAWKLTDQALIAKVAMNAESIDVRLVAVKKLEDPTLLAEIAEKEEKKLQKVAKERLKELRLKKK